MAQNDKWIKELKDGFSNVHKYLNEVIKVYPGSADEPKVASVLEFLKAVASLTNNSSFEECFKVLFDPNGPYISYLKEGIVKRDVNGVLEPSKLCTSSNFTFTISHLSLTSSKPETYTCKLTDIFAVTLNIIEPELVRLETETKSINSAAKKSKPKKPKAADDSEAAANDDEPTTKIKKEKKTAKNSLAKEKIETARELEKKMEAINLYFACTLAYTVKQYALTFSKKVSNGDASIIINANNIQVPTAPYGGETSAVAKRLFSNILQNDIIRGFISPIVGGVANLEAASDFIQNFDGVDLAKVKDSADQALKSGDVNGLIESFSEKFQSSLQKVEASDGIDACDQV